ADNKGDFYRLYITGYSSLREAIRDAKELKKSGVISGYSRVHSGEPVSDAPPDETAVNEKEGKIYIIHISSNKNEENAAKNAARLREYGYEAFYKFEKDLSGSWYRVYIGEFKDEAEARKKGMELLDREIISYFKPFAIDRKKLSN
ncbi:MAG: SPOR domain-containing protein, partial [Deltaproteobacteria bacterium]|nr:SPOR domain-containing protein [Deltaproteobacteria bacterium]